VRVCFFAFCFLLCYTPYVLLLWRYLLTKAATPVQGTVVFAREGTTTRKRNQTERKKNDDERY